MARNLAKYACQDCGANFTKWNGQCESCGAWNTIVEEAPRETAPKGLGSKKGRRIEFTGLSGPAEKTPRLTTGMAEFDRACGGGLVPGSVLLVGGDPGIGKSTLLLQVAAAVAAAHSGARCIYISGEESVDQLRLRAERLGLAEAAVEIAAATDVRDIIASLEGGPAPGLVVADSIQTMYIDSLDSAPGTVTQVRSSAQELIRLAKRMGFVLFLVGHVTKDGQIAGPKVLEHMVDTVLYFEGERGHQFRILRAVKNRFGAAGEIGVFEMTDSGLAQVANPSALFLSDHGGEVTGSSVFAGIEGSRPVLAEFQALTAPSPLGTPRRAVVGWDSGRLAMIIAVLEARCGLSLGANDIYLNVAGGLRIGEPAADLAVAAALVSSLTGVPVPADTVVFGEVGLSGEVRPVGQTDNRLGEAVKLGFTKALIPRRKGKGGNRRPPKSSAMEITELRHLDDLVGLLSRATPAVGGLPRAGHG